MGYHRNREKYPSMWSSLATEGMQEDGRVQTIRFVFLYFLFICGSISVVALSVCQSVSLSVCHRFVSVRAEVRNCTEYQGKFEDVKVFTFLDIKSNFLSNLLHLVRFFADPAHFLPYFL